MAVSLCYLCDFGGIAGSDMSMGHIFLQGVLAAIALAGGGATDRGVQARKRCDRGAQPRNRIDTW